MNDWTTHAIYLAAKDVTRAYYQRWKKQMTADSGAKRGEPSANLQVRSPNDEISSAML